MIWGIEKIYQSYFETKISNHPQAWNGLNFYLENPFTEGFLIYAAFGCKTSKSENCQKPSYELGHKFECGSPGDMGD